MLGEDYREGRENMIGDVRGRLYREGRESMIGDVRGRLEGG